MKFLTFLATVLVIVQISHGQSRGCPFASKPSTAVTCPNRNVQNPEFRPIDGTLENVCVNTGRPYDPFARLDKIHYDDCKWEVRRAKSGKPLPPVRQVVNKVFRHYKRELSADYRPPNFLIAMLGQYIAHEIGFRGHPDLQAILATCCVSSKPAPIEVRHRDCIYIPIESGDPDFGDYPHITCLNMARSGPQNENVFPLEQYNQNTAFLDNSNLYGNVKSASDSLRLWSGGQMITDSDNILPRRDTGVWFLGDIRLNQTPQLAALHSIFLREHNRIAKILEALNPHWDDQRLFEETRRIVIAEFQHIVYEEFLPTFVSPIIRFLAIPDHSADQGVATFNEFNTAALRVLHSVIPTNLLYIDKDGNKSTRRLYDLLNNSTSLQSHYDDILRGMLMQPIHSDGYNADLFRGLFKDSNGIPGTDILSIDLNRGRDHGLPPYANLLVLLKGRPITSFDHLAPFISRPHIDLLRNTYESVEDVDLMAGVLLEKPSPGTLMGPTAQFMFLRQFSRLKTADPYFYTNTHQNPRPFTSLQLKEIKKASTNLLFCMNSGVECVPKTAAYAPTSEDDVVSCKCLEKMSFESWREDVV